MMDESKPVRTTLTLQPSFLLLALSLFASPTLCPIFVCGFRDWAWAALHDDALAAAAGALAGLAHVHLALWCAGTEGSGAGGIGRHFLVVAAMGS